MSESRLSHGLTKSWSMMAVALFCALLTLNGCSDDNPADPTVDGCSHFDADGVILEVDGKHLVAQWEGSIDGEVEVEQGSEIDIDVMFLTPDSSRAVPSADCDDQSLEVIVDDEKVATVSTSAASGRWSFRLTGVEAGETSVSVRIIHIDHPDFTSLDLPVHVHHAEEVEIEGFEIRSGATVLASQMEGTVTGELLAMPSETLGPLQVVFLDGEGEEVEPEEGATLDLSIGSESIATVNPDGADPFAFSLVGVAEGMTTLSFDVLHKGHADFESQDISVRIATLPTPEAALIRNGLNPLSFWNYDPEEGPDEVQGGIVLDLSTSSGVLTLGWLGEYDGSQVNDKRPELTLAESDFEMEWRASTDGVVSVLPVANEPWSVELSGLAVGTTSLTFELKRAGMSVLEAGPFPVDVVDPSSATIQDHYLNLGGAWTVIVLDEEVVSSGCERDANPGHIDLEVGELSALYKITLLDDECAKIQLDSSYEYRYVIEDPSVARILQTPVHWGEVQIFHVEGMSVGSTLVSVYLFKNGSFLWKSPPYPLEVVAG